LSIEAQLVELREYAKRDNNLHIAADILLKKVRQTLRATKFGKMLKRMNKLARQRHTVVAP
jgi:hypothetical protein